MIITTENEIKKILKEAIEAGVSPEDLEPLREYLAEISAGGRLIDPTSDPMCFVEIDDDKKLIRDGGREVRLSTGYGSADDFEGVEFSYIK